MIRNVCIPLARATVALEDDAGEISYDGKGNLTGFSTFSLAQRPS
jgi:hypothetical protein